MRRIATGLVLGLAWFLLLFYGSFSLFWAVLLLLSAAALFEYAGLLQRRAGGDHVLTLILLGLLPTIGAYFGRIEPVTAGLVLALLLLFALTLCRFGMLGNGFDFVGRGTFGIVYGGLLPAHLVLIMARPHGAAWLAVLTGLIFASDTGAYYSGRLFGRHKLCPAISPGKTVEGFLGGLLAGVAAGTGLGRLLVPGSHLLPLALAALLVTCVGVMGDLLESVLKRSVAVKDSGALLPGHGGILDRADSLLVAAPVFYYLMVWGLITG
ncbi:MAG: phosphatidate cytidylyltransferase [Desulfobacteraceae bacterium]|nr:phosphatidate cytidylyltransferase [Desulfobacteraceae bacterium]